MKTGYVYILSNKNRTVLYIGATSNLEKRIELHVLGKATVFTKKYNVNELLYFEEFLDFHDAFLREKQLKKLEKRMEMEFNQIKEP